MAEIEKQVRRVWRRLNFQQFVEILIWCWVAALTVGLGCTVAGKFWQVLVAPWWVTLAASLGLGTLAAAAIWFFARRGPVDAALALDHAFGLKERVSSTLTLPADLRESSAGLALVNDATKRLEMIDVREKFGFRLPRTSWLPLVPALLVFLVASFVNLGQSDSAQAKPSTTKERDQIQQSTKVLATRLEEQKQKAKEQGLGETEKLLGELAKKATKDVSDSKDIDQKKALTKFNDIQDALKERREKLGSSEQLQRQLEKLKATAEKGPADKFQEALKHGDFKKAADELSKLAEQIKTGQLDDAQKKALEKQLNQMKDQLQKLADVQERRKQLEQQLKKAGAPEDVIKQELAKLDAQAKQLEKLQELAQKLGECQQCMAKGDTEKALEALNMSKADLQQLMKDLQELEMVQNALNDLADMKNAMVCKNCEGAGWPSCNSGRGRGNGFQRGARGDRDEEEDTVKSFDSKVPQKVRPGGKIEVTGLVSGKQIKGESHIDVQETLEAGTAAATDALNKQNIPRDYKKHAKAYFEGVGGSKP